MGDCCAPEAGPGGPIACRESQTPCPKCGSFGRPVADETIRAMLPASTALGLLVIERRFCKTPTCDVLYYGDDGRTVSKREARVRVGAKENEDPIPVCYCFDVTRADLREDVAQYGESKLLLRIKAEVRKGNCACETTNPSGACCLGDVNAVVKEEKRRLDQQPVARRADGEDGAGCEKACRGA